MKAQQSRTSIGVRNWTSTKIIAVHMFLLWFWQSFPFISCDPLRNCVLVGGERFWKFLIVLLISAFFPYQGFHRASTLHCWLLNELVYCLLFGHSCGSLPWKVLSVLLNCAIRTFLDVIKKPHRKSWKNELQGGITQCICCLIDILDGLYPAGFLIELENRS